MRQRLACWLASWLVPHPSPPNYIPAGSAAVFGVPRLVAKTLTDTLATEAEGSRLAAVRCPSDVSVLYCRRASIRARVSALVRHGMAGGAQGTSTDDISLQSVRSDQLDTGMRSRLEERLEERSLA